MFYFIVIIKHHQILLHCIVIIKHHLNLSNLFFVIIMVGFILIINHHQNLHNLFFFIIMMNCIVIFQQTLIIINFKIILINYHQNLNQRFHFIIDETQHISNALHNFFMSQNVSSLKQDDFLITFYIQPKIWVFYKLF